MSCNGKKWRVVYRILSYYFDSMYSRTHALSSYGTSIRKSPMRDGGRSFSNGAECSEIGECTSYVQVVPDTMLGTSARGCLLSTACVSGGRQYFVRVGCLHWLVAGWVFLVVDKYDSNRCFYLGRHFLPSHTGSCICMVPHPPLRYCQESIISMTFVEILYPITVICLIWTRFCCRCCCLLCVLEILEWVSGVYRIGSCLWKVYSSMSRGGKRSEYEGNVQSV